MFFFYFHYKLYGSLQTIPCELLEFSLSTRHLFFSWVLVYFIFSRISSALIPLANNLLTTLSASAFFASSAALASAFVFFAQRAATSGMHRLWWYWFWAGFAAFRSEYSLIPNGLIQLLS